MGRREDDGLSEELDRPRVGAVGAREDLEQRRLARAVFAEQRVNLGGTHFEMDVLERLHAGKTLADARHPEDRPYSIGRCVEHRPAFFQARTLD
jgi:autonomous glycyl radical cofactor GrcA